ncbi:MAG TPA: hypothetical protein DEF34_12915 [Desulfotomaculum sp.]|nr:hypothetical protein [Desulfotomaculum sp.]
MFPLKKLIRDLLQTKWEIIYSTQNIEKYAKVKGRLLNNNLRMKTEMFSSGGGHGGGYGFATTYHILVRLEDVHKASEILNSTK